jgi:thioredoxin 1
MNTFLKSKLYINKAFSFRMVRNFCTKTENNIVVLEKSEDFDKLLTGSKLPVIVDFYADWCPPCKKLIPVLEAKQKEKNGFKLIKINVDNHPELAERFNVSGIPHVVAFKDGKKNGEFAGFNEAALNNMIAKF